MSSQQNVLAACIGIYKVWKDIVVNGGLKWSSGHSEDAIIKRFTKPQDPGDLFEWVGSLKREDPNLTSLLDFAMATGIRFIEVVNSYNLAIDLNKKGRLNDYYNFDHELLQHYKFKDLFQRRSKKVFITFASRNLIERVRESERLTKEAIENRVKRSPYPSRFGDLREYWASVMTRHLSQPEIDFLQGRISTSIFMRNYFNPAWINDLKQRTLKAVEEILQKIA